MFVCHPKRLATTTYGLRWRGALLGSLRQPDNHKVDPSPYHSRGVVIVPQGEPNFDHASPIAGMKMSAQGHVDVSQMLVTIVEREGKAAQHGARCLHRLGKNKIA